MIIDHHDPDVVARGGATFRSITTRLHQCEGTPVRLHIADHPDCAP
jgi:hypothetical protein